MDLYIEPSLVLEKTAAPEVTLAEDANSWPQAIMQELYKQVPYVSDFDIDVTMDRVDAERGYGFGHILLASKSDSALGTPDASLHAAGINKVRIPVIIKERKLQPFDVVVTEDSKMLPLTEGRLRQALFRPQPFDVTSKTPGDQSMIGQLYPPYRQNSGGFGAFGNGAVVDGGMGKVGSAAQPQLNERIQTVLGLTNPPTKAEGEKKVKDLKKSAEAKEAGSKRFLRIMKSVAKNPNITIESTPASHGLAGALDTAQQKVLRRVQRYPKGIDAYTEIPNQKKFKEMADPLYMQHISKGAASLVPNSNLGTQNSQSIKKLMKTGSVLKAISSAVSVADCEKFASTVSDPGVQEAYARNGYATVDALSTIMAFTPSAVQKIASALPGVIRPDVVQVKKASRGYTVKTARHDLWAPHEYTADRGQIVKAFGEKVAFEADTTGSVTMAEGAGVATPEPVASKAQLIDRAGMYKVKNLGGEELVGYVFPNLVDLDGTELPMALFTNGSMGALQAEIHGEPLAEAKNPPMREPQTGEEGVFTWTTAEGEVKATVPLTMLGCYQEEGGEKHLVETMEGAQMMVACQPNIQTATCVDETCLLPAQCRWMPLGHMEETVLEGAEAEGAKEASARREFAAVTVRSDGSSFSFEGFPLAKIAFEERAFLSVDDSLFLLGGLGVDLDAATVKLAEAAVGMAPVQIRVGRSIKTAGDAMGAARAAAAEKLAQFPRLGVDLFKEAAFIPDPMAVDTVLSLGFINPENLSTFVTYLPQMEQSQHRLCELLIAARLGLQTVEPGPLEKAIKSLESVLEGLKVIAFQEN